MIGHCVSVNQKNLEQVNEIFKEIFTNVFFLMVICNLTKQVKVYIMADMWLCLVLAQAQVTPHICDVVVARKNHVTINYQLVANANQEDICVFIHLE